MKKFVCIFVILFTSGITSGLNSNSGLESYISEESMSNTIPCSMLATMYFFEAIDQGYTFEQADQFAFNFEIMCHTATGWVEFLQ